MQPYVFPYIGYFQLINAVDKFVVYDNIEFTKKGWINRNRILINGKDDYFTLPLKKDSDYLNVDQRKLSDTFATESVKLLRRIAESYKKAPHFSTVYPLVESVILSGEENLFEFIFKSLQNTCAFLGIETALLKSSVIPIDHQLKGQDKVIAICKALNAKRYINPIGGVALYSKDVFKQNEIELNFIRSGNIEYKQFGNIFVPWLSIIDVMMFNSLDEIKNIFSLYKTE